MALEKMLKRELFLNLMFLGDYSEFGGYHVKDTVGYDMATLEFYSSNDTAWIYAISVKRCGLVCSLTIRKNKLRNGRPPMRNQTTPVHFLVIHLR